MFQSPSKYVTDAEGLEYVLGISKEGANKQSKPKKVDSNVTRIINCPALGPEVSEKVCEGPAKKGSGNSSEVLKKYKSKYGDQTIGDKWTAIWSDSDNVINTDVPSVCVPGFFTCDYKLIVRLFT